MINTAEIVERFNKVSLFLLQEIDQARVFTRTYLELGIEKGHALIAEAQSSEHVERAYSFYSTSQ